MTLCKTVNCRSRRRSLARCFYFRWVLNIIPQVYYFHIICLKLHLVDQSGDLIHIVTTPASTVYFHQSNQQLRKNKDLLSRREKGSKVQVWKFCWCSPLKVAFRRSTSAWSQSDWYCCVLQISFAWTVGCFNVTCKPELLPNSLTIF